MIEITEAQVMEMGTAEAQVTGGGDERGTSHG